MKDTTITCLICGERKKPAVWRAVMCQDCSDKLLEDMNTPKPQPVGVPSGFRRNDYKGDL